ncbi:Receptor-like serine/threonine-protein kinase SD1-7 [Camellia lanceoleosa]|uniref:Receptor-like serine/threonine-protein kinase SD1-7 n=1 Tax=Camellia lanceoleosa TaxID=1840588 RepID=A0ACC0IB30_9ERIC|nr:Receptor-like serine/threonine-protein kinase SD1-7 [Camellia lanceoleosa]
MTDELALVVRPDVECVGEQVGDVVAENIAYETGEARRLRHSSCSLQLSPLGKGVTEKQRKHSERYFSYFVKNSSTVAARWELQLQGKIMQFTLVQNNGSQTWRFKTANPCHNSVENGSAVCLNGRKGSELFVPTRVLESDANFEAGNQNSLLMQILETFTFSLKNSTKEIIPSEESRKKNSFRSKQKHWWIWSFAAVALVVAMLLLGFFCYLRWRNLKRMEQEGERKTNQDKFMFLLRSKITPFSERNNTAKFGFGKKKGQQLQLYSLPQIAAATKNFSINKKLGQGGFGKVYKTWDLWKEGISLELTDPVLSSQCPENELLRCIHVGLLCVQECAIDRPTVSDIICMLTNVTTILPDPKRPAFYTGRSGIQAQFSSTGKTDECSLNCVSISVIEAR